jgi:hypothetical protein
MSFEPLSYHYHHHYYNYYYHYHYYNYNNHHDNHYGKDDRDEIPILPVQDLEGSGFSQKSKQRADSRNNVSSRQSSSDSH